MAAVDGANTNKRNRNPVLTARVPLRSDQKEASDEAS